MLNCGPTHIQKNANPSSLLDALNAARPLQDFQPAAAPPVSDVDSLHSRIATCLSTARTVTAEDGTSAIAKLERLIADSTAVRDTIARFKAGRAKPTSVVTAATATDTDQSTALEGAVSHFVRQHVQSVAGCRYSISRPPPTVTEAEVDRALAALTAKERKALTTEFELTCVDGFDIMSGSDEALPEVPETNTEDNDIDQPPSSTPAFTLALQKDSVSSLQQLALDDKGAPGFTLEAMPPNATEFSESADEQRTELRPTGVCTVEVEYTMDRWAHEAASSSLRTQTGVSVDHHTDTHDRPEDGFAVPSFPALHQNAGELAEVADSLSFDQFSRLALRQREEASRQPPVPHKKIDKEAKKNLAATPHTSPAKVIAALETASTRPAQRGQAASSHTAPSSAPPTDTEKQQQQHMESQRAAYIRQRVREVLLANRVESRERDRIALDVLAKTREEGLAVAQTALLAVERLTVLVREASVLLSTLEDLEQQASATQLCDPTQYLLVPRLRTTCYNINCHKAFSAVVLKQCCRRCGQFFCSHCCAHRGIGPAVQCDGKWVSLGWEPLCHACFAVCEQNQRKVATERRRRCMLTAAPTPPQPPAATSNGPLPQSPPHSAESPGPYVIVESDSDTDGQRPQQQPSSTADAHADPSEPSALERLSVKEAVLFGACCTETRLLSDGRPPFYVTINADNTAELWDILTYRVSSLKGTILAQYQSSGEAAQKLVANTTTQTAKKTRYFMRRRIGAPPPTTGATKGETRE